MEDVSHLIIKVSSDQAVTADKRLDNLGKRAAQTERATDGLTKSFMRLATAAGTLIVLKQGISLLADFEESISHVRAVTEATEEQMADLTAVARKLGAETRFSARQAAEGMKLLGMAGFNTSQIIAAMPGMLDLATVGAMDLAKAADIASNVMQGFSMAAGESSRMADVLAVAASASNTSVEQLGEGFKYVAAIAAGMGQSLEDTAALMGVLSNAGLQATMAGTGLRQVLSSLANPTREAREVLEAYGLSLDDVNPSIHRVSDIMAKMGKAGISASDALIIAGDRGGVALSILTSKTPDIVRMNEVMGASAGRAKEIARVMGDNLKGDFLELKSAVEELVLQMGDAGLLKALRDGTKGATEFVRAVNDVVASGEFGVWVDLVMGKLNLLTDGFYNAAENIAIAMNAINDGSKEIGLTDWLADALEYLPENIRAATALIGTAFGTWKEMGDNVGRGVYEVIIAWLKFFGKSAKNVWTEFISQWKDAFLEFVVFIKEQGLKTAELMNKFLPKKLQYSDDYLAGVRESIEKTKAALKSNDHPYIEEQTRLAKEFDDTFQKVSARVAQNLVFTTEAFEEQVTAILNERDANIKSSDDKIAKIKELRAAYEAAKKAREEAEKENAGKAGTPPPKTEPPPDDGHFMVKEFAQLRKSLQLQEKSIYESYEKRLELIRKNTQEGDDVRIELERALNAELAIELEQAFQSRADRLLTLEEELRIAIMEGREGDITMLQDMLAREEQQLFDSYQRRKQMILENTELTEEEKAKLVAALDAKYTRVTLDSQVAKNKAQLNLAADFFGNLSQMASVFGKKGAKVAKALAIVQTTIKTYESATSAYAALAGIPYVGPALGAAAAGAAIAAGMANVAAIRSQQDNVSAYEHGGMIGAGNYGIVGEAGAEIVKGPAVVTSARDTAGLMRQPVSNKVTLNIINQGGTGIEVVPQGERETNDGKIIDVIVRRVKSDLTNDISRGGTPFTKAAEATWGLKRGAAA
jgi:TP901 family phage tail tape measure protein